MWNATSDSNDGTKKEEDPFVGDLNNWEFLTCFFDHDDFLNDSSSITDENFDSIDEKPSHVPVPLTTPLDCRLNTLQEPFSPPKYGRHMSTLLSQTSNSVRVPLVPGYDSCHPYGIPINNFPAIISSSHHHEQQTMRDLPSSYCDLLTSRSSNFVAQSRNYESIVPCDIMNEPLRSHRVVERLNVRRVPMDIGGHGRSYSFGQSATQILVPCQSYPDHCAIGATTHGFLNGDKLSRFTLDKNDTRESTTNGGLFFDYSPPLPSHDLLKPLTAYNFFYRDERDNIIGGMQADGDPIPPALCDFSETKLRKMLNQRWYTDPGKKKRSHRKTHGKLPFETLSKIIGLRWQNLSDEGREFYRWVAKLDQAQYRKFIAAKEASDCEKTRAYTV